MNNRIGALEGLRGWAALLVVIYHLPKWHPYLDAPLVNNGHLMVPLFFVLSGFVIHSAYAHRIDQPPALLRFLSLRFWRLYPVHLLFLAAYLAFECVRWIAVYRLSVSDVRLVPFSQNSGTALLQQLFLIQAIGPTGNAQTFNGPAWSISVEFYTYVLFGVLALVCGRRLTPVLAILLLCGVMLLSRDTGFESLLTCIVGFSLGTLVSALSRSWPVRMPGWAASIAFLAFFGYLAISPEPYLGFVFALSAGLVMAISRADGGLAFGMLSGPQSLWLGAVSYSLYMCHGLVLWVIANVFKRGLGLKETLRTDGKWVLDLTAAQAIAASAISVAAALTIAWLVMRFVEIPAREWSRRRAGAGPLESASGRATT
jgi:peptidoglycan/LPS O-acetylase OafA/YrhL